MKIRYIDGNRFYRAFVAGGNAVINNQDYLNKINVFPVADADTGTNMASTMMSIIEGSINATSIKSSARSIADAALMGARGNSGIIFAQFVHGISMEIKNEEQTSASNLSQYLNKAVDYAYQSILEPVEGTILTVMKEWAQSFQDLATKHEDIAIILGKSLVIAQKSLNETPQKLKILAECGVIDAGAQGFVDFLAGVENFIKYGKLDTYARKSNFLLMDSNIHAGINSRDIKYRYCCEAIITQSKTSLGDFQNSLSSFGDSLVIAGSNEKMRLHIHTNRPAEIFNKIKKDGDITYVKVDDMRFQRNVTKNRKYNIAIVTDTACDIPAKFIEKYQVYTIPFKISFGKSLFLDKLTLTSKEFYEMLKNDKNHPQTAQPHYKDILNLFSFLSSHYDSIIAVHISSKLSGVYQQSIIAREKIGNNKITVIDSKHLSVSQGLLVKRIALAIEDGLSYEVIISKIDEWINKTKIFVDIKTLKYMVRGGRISPVKGAIAGLLNLKPIITLDSEGRGIPFGKSFSRKGNMKKILELIADMNNKGKIYEYAIVHSLSPDRADLYAQKVSQLTGQKPAYIMNIAPVVGVHNGVGALGIGVMSF